MVSPRSVSPVEVNVPAVVWKRQFTFVYGRLYENNGRRTSVRVLRYSLDALACKCLSGPREDELKHACLLVSQVR